MMFRILSFAVIVGCLFGIGFFTIQLLFSYPEAQTLRPIVVRTLPSIPPNSTIPPREKELRRLIESHFSSIDGTFAIVVEDLSTGEHLASVNDERVIQTASLYKLFTMAALFDAAKKNGEEMSGETKEAIKRMITISSNEDGQFLSSTAGWENITAWAKENGFADTTLSEIPPVTSARDLARFFRLLWKKELVSVDASEEMLRILFDQRLNDRIPKYLPDDVRVAHKTGRVDGWLHDAGIVEGTRSAYVMVLMAEGVEDVDAVKERMALFSKDVFDVFETVSSQKRP